MRLKFMSLALTVMLLAALCIMGGGTEAAITLPPGFFAATAVSALTNPRGVAVIPPLSGFPAALFVVEQSLNRVSVAPFGGTPAPFATGLSTPTDLLPSPSESGPFGNFLFVSEAGANRISKIDKTGAVSTFASLPSVPKRMAFSTGQGPTAFGNFLFVTLANGTLVKVDPTGAVTICASGLSSPEGFVFGPGGTFFKSNLFVAESTGNRISRVDPACTVSLFASTGLSTPVGLAISPGGPYGPADTFTLYVVNAGTRIDRVDKNGNVTPFASGFVQADTVHFVKTSFFSLPLPIDRWGGNVRLAVSDAGPGTIEYIAANFPSAQPDLIGCNPCKTGDTFTLNLIVQNSSSLDVSVEVKAGFELPDGTPINFSPLKNKHFEASLPKGLPATTIAWLSFTMPAIPPGQYCYRVVLAELELLASSLSRRGCFTVLP